MYGHEKDTVEKKLSGRDWLNPDNYLPALAPDLAQEYRAYMESEDDKPGIYERLNDVYRFAYSMVRYAVSPHDSTAEDAIRGDSLINPETGLPFKKFSGRFFNC